MSNRPKLQKPRISNREMARDTKTLIGAGVEMCKLIRRATPNNTGHLRPDSGRDVK